MNGSNELVDILEKILNYTSIDPELKPSLQKGLSLEEIELKLRNFPLCVPKEVKRLYQWHDGMDDTGCELFHYHRFLPLDESLTLYKGWIDDPDYSNLLPLFEFEGEYYCILCSQTKEESGSIWFILHGTDQEYDSLTTMLLAALECYEAGAYQPTLKYSHAGHSYVETKIDEQKVAEIKLKHNPIRQESFEYLQVRKRWYYHP